MQWIAISKHWTAYIPAILQRWPEAEEDDLISLDGTQTSLASYLAKKTGRPISDLDEELEDWRAGATPADIRMDESEDMRNIDASARYVPVGEDPSDDDAAFGDDGVEPSPVGRTG